jgi:hypothetical protein
MRSRTVGRRLDCDGADSRGCDRPALRAMLVAGVMALVVAGGEATGVITAGGRSR